MIQKRGRGRVEGEQVIGIVIQKIGRGEGGEPVTKKIERGEGRKACLIVIERSNYIGIFSLSKVRNKVSLAVMERH